jgi:hypothetical protein
MAGVLQHLRSSALNKRPNPASMVDGQVAINYASGSPGMFFKDSSGSLVKVGPVHVGSSAPNAVPASGGTAGNSLGEQWLDTSGGTYVFKIWDGGTWRSEAGEFVNTTGDTMTGALGIIAGSASTPGLFFSGDANSGLYSPGADQVAISTNGTGRLFVDANGNVQIGSNTSTGARVDITASSDIFSFGSASRRLYAWADSGGVSLLNADSQTGDGFYIDEAGSNIRFWTGSTERMRLDSSGRLGLGTSSPLGTLSVGNHANDVGQLNDVFVSGDKVNADGYFARLMFRNSNQSGGSTASVRGERSGDNFGTALTFYTQAAGSSGDGTEKLRITPAGNVGIGTTSPSRKLEVSDAGVDNFIRVNSNGATKTGIEFASSATVYSQLYFNNVAPYDLSLLQQYTTGSLIFGTNNTERARIDSSGRLLVGTSSAETWFGSLAQIQAAGSEASFTAIRNQNTDSGAYLFLGKSRGTTANSTTIVQNNDQLGGIIFLAADGVNNRTQAASIYSYVDGTPGAGDMPGRLVFSTTADGASSPTERMRITSDGSVIINGDSSTAGARFAVLGGSATSACFSVESTNTSAFGAIKFRNGNGEIGSISFFNSGVNYNTSSDYRLKENVAPLTGAIDRVNDLQVHRFNFIADPDKTVDGFIAHEAQAVVPECVTGEKDAVDDDGNPVYQGIDQSKLVPLLTAALQEALAEIESLKARVTALEA